MKKIAIYLFVLTLSIAGISSCGKYEEGPKFTFLTKKARITNTWNLASRTTNGSTTNLSNDTWEVVIKDDETYTSKATILGVPFFNEIGTWKFSDDKLELLTTPASSANAASWEIVRLKKDELKLRYYNGGDTIVDTFN
ncbi:MAG: lipocalin family protein [Crocinitomicaceae bacterium]